jgi:hypothetical protein
VPWKKLTGKTPLTESQAKTLALWWGGDYLSENLRGEDSLQVLHGVILPQTYPGSLASHFLEDVTFWSQEEAREWENRRSSINPGAEAWVG